MSARKIASMINFYADSALASGFIVTDSAGNGGAWYSDNARPELADDEIAWPCRTRVSIVKVKVVLDARRDGAQ